MKENVINQLNQLLFDSLGCGDDRHENKCNISYLKEKLKNEYAIPIKTGSKMISWMVENDYWKKSGNKVELWKVYRGRKL